MSGTSGGALVELRDYLAMVRALPRLQAIFLVAGVAVALFIALEHWVGLFLAGLIIGLVATTLRQAIALGVSVSVAIAVAMFTYAARHDQLGAVLALGDFTVFAVAMVFGLILLGSLIRGVV